MLELTGLRKRYGDVVALEGLTPSARRGRLLGFVDRRGQDHGERAVFGLVRL